MMMELKVRSRSASLREIAHFQQQDYQILITVGTPLGRGSYLSEYQNFAQLSAATAVKLGFDENKIAIVPTPPIERNRTLASAIAVQQWWSAKQTPNYGD